MSSLFLVKNESVDINYYIFAILLSKSPFLQTEQRSHLVYGPRLPVPAPNFGIAVIKVLCFCWSGGACILCFFYGIFARTHEVGATKPCSLAPLGTIFWVKLLLLFMNLEGRRRVTVTLPRL
jgi:hypothetical protein